MSYVNPSESDHETRRRLRLDKGQKIVDRMHQGSGFDAEITASASPEGPYLTPRQRQRAERSEAGGTEQSGRDESDH